LEQIPASAIESIELVTNPSAKYDPEGTGGIINIILKKNVTTGFNGMVSANAGTRDKYTGSLNLNYRINGFNFFARLIRE
jgi:outer membrane receptor protein involved in Fe transport